MDSTRGPLHPVVLNERESALEGAPLPGHPRQMPPERVDAPGEGVAWMAHPQNSHLEHHPDQLPLDGELIDSSASGVLGAVDADDSAVGGHAPDVERN